MYQCDAFASRFASITRAISDSEAATILAGTQAGFEMPVMTGTAVVFPNNQYHVEGSGNLYVNDYLTRTVTTGDIITSAYENKIVLTEGSTIQLKM
jgi:hypothetical protein